MEKYYTAFMFTLFNISERIYALVFCLSDAIYTRMTNPELSRMIYTLYGYGIIDCSKPGRCSRCTEMWQAVCSNFQVKAEPTCISFAQFSPSPTYTPQSDNSNFYSGFEYENLFCRLVCDPITWHADSVPDSSSGVIFTFYSFVTVSCSKSERCWKCT